MALSNLVPSISACLNNKGDKLKVTDITGVYHVTDNVGGWQNAATILSANVDVAVIKIFNSSRTLLKTVDVLSQIPDPVTGNITFSDIDWTYGDGRFYITYELQDTDPDPDQTVSVEICKFFYSKARCAVDKLRVSADAYECGCGCSLDNKIKDFLLAESLLLGIKSAAISRDYTSFDNILSVFSRLGAFKKCKC